MPLLTQHTYTHNAVADPPPVLTALCSCMQQQLSGSRGAAGSSRQTTAAAAGAWAAWSCAPAQGRGEPQRLVIDPREASLLDRLRLQLGQPITLHFVAVDYVGCPAVLSKQQRQELRRRSLLLLPANGEKGLTALRACGCACKGACWRVLEGVSTSSQVQTTKPVQPCRWTHS